MKWLIDAQLPPRLCGWFKKKGETCLHTIDISGGLNLSDDVLWNYAKENDFIIVSKDTDFFERTLLYGSPPQVLFVQLGNILTHQQIQIF